MTPSTAVRRAVEPLQVLELGGEAAEWDRFVSCADGSTFCHLAGWREVMEDVLGHRCRYAVAVDGEGAWRGVLPLVHVRSRIFGNYLLSMPFLNYGGPLGTPEAQRRLLVHSVGLAEAAGVRLLELRSRRRIPVELPPTIRKVAVTLPLPATVPELWERTFRAKLRSQVRRPLKEGMTLRLGASELDDFYEVFARHMRDLGTPVLPRRFFARLARLFPDQVVFATVRRGTEAVAGGCGFIWGDEFEITWAAALRDHSRSAPNMLLYAGLMEEMIRRGIRVFNFGRCTPGSGTHQFKRQWGGVDEPLPWVQWSARGVDSTPSPERPVFDLATRAWQRLPLAVANRVGPLFARQLP
jgi:serine/alanine adding enzyme